MCPLSLREAWLLSSEEIHSMPRRSTCLIRQEHFRRGARQEHDNSGQRQGKSAVNYKQLMIKDLQDLYQSESEQARQLPQLASAARSEALRAALQEHVDQTQQHVLRLQQILEMSGETPGGDGQVTPGVHGLVSEVHKKIAQFEDPILKDLEIIAEAQKMEHYEIACYGTARAMARTVGLDEAGRLLQATLEEEEAADKRLTNIALPIHKEAAELDPTVEH
jgi:ferritin-like metal-binding protein YciE